MSSQDVRKWDNGVYKWDVTEASYQLNPWLKHYGQDRFTYVKEQSNITATFYFAKEAKLAHGYPLTSYL